MLVRHPHVQWTRSSRMPANWPGMLRHLNLLLLAAPFSHLIVRPSIAVPSASFSQGENIPA